MAQTIASLADGQLANSKGTLFTASARTHATIILANTSSSVAYAVNLYLKRSGSTSRRLIGKDLSLAASTNLIYPGYGATGIRLSIGDIIEGDAGTAAVIDYSIVGATES